MSKTTDGIKLIQDDFRERFGVEVKIHLRVHPTFSNVVTQESADSITKTLAMEMNQGQKHLSYKESSWATVEGDDVDLSVFYELPGKEVSP